MGPAPRGAGDSTVAALPAHRMGRRGRRTVAAVSECEHWHRWSGTCARLARTVLPSIHTSMPICRRPWSTSRRHPVYTRHARTHSSGQSDFSGQEDPRGRRPGEAGIFMRHGWSGRARRCWGRIGARTLSGVPRPRSRGIQRVLGGARAHWLGLVEIDHRETIGKRVVSGRGRCLMQQRHPPRENEHTAQAGVPRLSCAWLRTKVGCQRARSCEKNLHRPTVVQRNG